MAWCINNFKDLKTRTYSDTAFATTRNLKYKGYERSLASLVFKFSNKKIGAGTKNKIKKSQQLANELHKPIIRKFKKRKLYSSYKDNIWGVDLADMQLINKYNKGIKYLLCN